MASIEFTDDIGAAELTNGKPSPADRFDSWTIVPIVNGPLVHRQSDKRPVRFRTSTVRGASFSLSKIPIRTTDMTRYYTIAARLVEHLQNGGTCTVNTDDSESASYSGCYLMPDTQPALTPPDENQLEATLSIAVFVPGASTQMTCEYDA